MLLLIALMSCQPHHVSDDGPVPPAGTVADADTDAPAAPAADAPTSTDAKTSTDAPTSADAKASPDADAKASTDTKPAKPKVAKTSSETVRPGIVEKRGKVSLPPLPKAARPLDGSSPGALGCAGSCGKAFVVRDADDVFRRSGARVALEGQLVEKPLPNGHGQGTALELRDGTDVWVTYGEPPHGWDLLVGDDVRVIGVLWDGPPPDLLTQGSLADVVEAPHLVDWEGPLPLHRAKKAEEPADTGEPSH